MLLALGVLLVLGLLTAWARPDGRELEGLRRQLGGHVEGRELVLDDGVRLRRQGWGRLEARVPVEALGAFSIRATAGGLRRTGDSQLLGTPPITAGVGEVVLRDRELRVVCNGGPEPAFVERARALARRVDESWTGPWTTQGGSRGLRLMDHALVGFVDGLAVRVELVGAHTVVTVEGPLRPVRAVHRDRAGELPDARPTGLPVLDLCLAVTTGESLEESLVEPMLTVLHAWPESELSPEAVRLRLPGLVTEGLGERIDEAVELARRLRS